MKIRQFAYGGDNLGYLLHGRTQALAIDGGAVDEIMKYVRDQRLSLTHVTNTHGHADHTTGTDRLAALSGATRLDHNTFADGETIPLDGETVTVRRTPGHTADAVCFAVADVLVTGDTLFNGTVGNCFSGDLRSFYRSIRLLMGYPGHTRIYAGHDYVMESLAFARHLTPDNPAIDVYAGRYDRTHVVSTLDEEMAVNPYLRFNAADMVALLASRGLPTETEFQRWEGIMSIE